MYLDALSFLEDERETFRPYEALSDLSDAQLEVPVEAANGWSGRDLMGHLLLWQEAALASAKELAIGEQSPTQDRLNAAFEDPAYGDRANAEALEHYRAMPLADVRARFRELAGDLRGYLTVVPESRWIKHADHQNWFFGETIEHYEQHLPELTAILAAAG